VASGVETAVDLEAVEVDASVKSLYIHCPFCRSKCHYCDFYSQETDKFGSAEVERFKYAMRLEIEKIAGLLAFSLRTIYVGGGTPSLFSAKDFEYILDPIKQKIGSSTEFTVEVNPSSINRQKLFDYKAIGINRISIGIQSFNPGILTWLGRIHGREEALNALNDVFAESYENVSADLIAGIPNQTEEQLEEDLALLCSFPIKHISCYLLTLAENSRYYSCLPNDEDQLSHYLKIDEYLRNRNFRHYEVSNFCLPGFEARHNTNYWLGGSYLAVGPSAHSFDAKVGKRWKNVSSIEEYCKRLLTEQSPTEWEETLTEQQKEIERWMLLLRLDQGVPAEWIDSEHRKKLVADYVEQGLMEYLQRARTYRLTARGMAILDHVVSALS